MSRFYSVVFTVGMCAFVVFAGAATVGSLEDFGWRVADLTRHRLENVFSWGGAIFLLCGFLLLLEAIHFVRTSWGRLSPFGRFIGTVGLLTTTVIGGYLYHLFFVTLARPSSK